eukprot:475136-Amphidinium_carterae.1
MWRVAQHKGDKPTGTTTKTRTTKIGTGKNTRTISCFGLTEQTEHFSEWQHQDREPPTHIAQGSDDNCRAIRDQTFKKLGTTPL